MNTHTNTNTNAAPLAVRRTRPEPRPVPVFLDDGQPHVYADGAAQPELEPAADAYGRAIGFLAVDAGEGSGDTRPIHAPLAAANLDAELEPLGLYKTAEGRLLADFRLFSLAGTRIECAAHLWMEVNPAAPVGAVWDALWRPAFPEADGEG